MSIPVSTLTGSNTINQMMYNVNTIKDLAANSASAVTGPGSSTDNAVVRFDGTSGSTAQNSGVTIADDNSMIISGSSSGDMLRITQTGAGNALLVEDSTNPDSTPFVVDATGDVLIGTATAIPGAFSDLAKLQVAQNTGEAVQQNFAFTANAGGAYLYLNKSRSSTIGTNTIVQDGDLFGGIVFAGADGTTYHRGALINAEVDGTPGTNDMPGRLVFSTTADGASSPTERMRIDSAGNVGLGVTATTKLDVAGSIRNTPDNSSYLYVGRFSSGYGGSAISTSGSATFLSMQIEGSEKMRIDSNGRVGIGDISPTEAGLVVASVSNDLNTSARIAIKSNETSAATFLRIGRYGSGDDTSITIGNNYNRDGGSYSADYSSAGVTNINFNDSGYLTFGTGAAASTDPTERMRIDSSGLVGIGRTPTTNLLEVAGTIESTSGGFKFPDGSTQTSAASAGITTGKAIAMAIVFG